MCKGHKQNMDCLFYFLSFECRRWWYLLFYKPAHKKQCNNKHCKKWFWWVGGRGSKKWFLTSILAQNIQLIMCSVLCAAKGGHLPSTMPWRILLCACKSSMLWELSSAEDKASTCPTTPSSTEQTISAWWLQKHIIKQRPWCECCLVHWNIHN